MQESVEFGTISPVSPWIRVAAKTNAGNGPKTSFRLMILFLLILYSSIAVWFKSLDALRPALVVAVAALLMLVVELPRSGQGFRISHPQGILLLAFLAVCFVASFDAFWPRLAFDRTSDVIKIVLIYI